MLGETSESNLKVGLDMVGKASLNIREWTGKFAQEQHKHQYPDTQEKSTAFGKTVKKQLQKFKLTVRECTLCLTEKPKDQFFHMCKCHHEYCYNCLNTYAISRIKGQSPVICPQQDCHETMPLTSQIYKYLPDQVKIIFLNNRHAWKNKAETLCNRCLEPKHAGQCQYALSPNLISDAYHYRQCSKCKTEINMTQGKKRVKCSKCGHQLCYLCGTDWKDEKKGAKHICGSKGQLLRLQKAFTDKKNCSCINCTECCNCQCGSCDCYCCDCDGCRHCGDDLCCQICFYCECAFFNPCCALWNVVSIPIRIIFQLLILAWFLTVSTPLLTLVFFWIIISLAVGFTAGACQLISKVQGCLKLVLILFYPITAFAGFFLTLCETSEMVVQPYSKICEMGGEMTCNLWTGCSPKNCNF